jgi:hypothetical protein
VWRPHPCAQLPRALPQTPEGADTACRLEFSTRCRHTCLCMQIGVQHKV